MTVRELFALVVGEYGCDPRYFLNEMTPAEAADYVEGARRRSRHLYESARVGWWMQAADPQHRTMQEIFPFAWDEKPKRKRVTKKQRDALREQAAAIAEKLSKANNG